MADASRTIVTLDVLSSYNTKIQKWTKALTDPAFKYIEEKNGVYSFYKKTKAEIDAASETVAADFTIDLSDMASDEALQALAAIVGNHKTTGSDGGEVAATGLCRDVDILKAGSTVEGSVAYQIAQIVEKNGNESIDTLKEIAEWIVNDTTGAAKMANDIKANTEAIGTPQVAADDSQGIEAKDATGLYKYIDDKVKTVQDGFDYATEGDLNDFFTDGTV